MMPSGSLGLPSQLVIHGVRRGYGSNVERTNRNVYVGPFQYGHAHGVRSGLGAR